MLGCGSVEDNSSSGLSTILPEEARCWDHGFSPSRSWSFSLLDSFPGDFRSGPCGGCPPLTTPPFEATTSHDGPSARWFLRNSSGRDLARGGHCALCFPFRRGAGNQTLARGRHVSGVRVGSVFSHFTPGIP